MVCTSQVKRNTPLKELRCADRLRCDGSTLSHRACAADKPLGSAAAATAGAFESSALRVISALAPRRPSHHKGGGGDGGG